MLLVVTTPALVMADVCNSSPCSNGGTCIDYGATYACTCTSAWSGTTCTVVVPIITKITGCARDVGSTTTDCPTEGGITITLHGTSFTSPPTVFVGGNDCGNATVFDSGTKCSCRLPIGTGIGLGVSIAVQDAASIPYNLLSYAVPTVTSVQSDECTQSGSSVMLCPRAGNFTLTVIGRDFGQYAPTVVIGRGFCTDLVPDPIQPHRIVRCKAPSATTLFQPILVLYVEHTPTCMYAD